ncbi:MAG: response regulator [Phaeodactylibacter sp.]|nr:response regulator [Phaeodactylibacter sp.]
MLIVEDNSDQARYLVNSFNPAYNLEVAYNGRQGIDKAVSLIPDIIITDVMMPEKDGFELCGHLKHHNLTSHIPIIMLTARVDADSRLAGLRRGADAYNGQHWIIAKKG